MIVSASTNVVTYSGNQGLAYTPNHTILADRNGNIWYASSRGVAKWQAGRVTPVRGAPLEVDPRYQDSAGRVWLAGTDAIGYVQADRYTPLSGVPKGVVTSVAADTGGSLWVASAQALVEVRGGRVVGQVPWTSLGHSQWAYALAADPLRGGIWLGWLDGGLEHFKDGRVRASFTLTNKSGTGEVRDIRVNHDGTVWAATADGLTRVSDGNISTLSSKNGLPCDSVIWMMEDADRTVWLYSLCGLVRIERSEITAWVTDPNRTVQAAVFDSSDGVWNIGLAIWTKPRVTQAPDGRIWFTGDDGIRVFDPRHVGADRAPPPVQIEQVIADRKTYDALPQLHFAALTRDVEIDFTALSFTIPEKILFRYKLADRDSEWENVGNRRAAFYNDLAPGRYRFLVTARNSTGEWNATGASLDFSIAPAYYQTAWFRASCGAAFLLLVWTLYRYRLRQIRLAFNVRLEERVGERLRIARDLHDTLLQSFQGLLLRFQTARELLLTRPAEAEKTLESAIDQTAQAITEGREAVQGLRASAVERNDLARAIRTVGEQIATEAVAHPSAALHVEVEGTPRTLHPIVRDEIYRIGSEAMRNAFRHAAADKIEVELRYDDRQLRLRVRDDGKGIDAEYLNSEGRQGHFGLHGMRERAKLIGGTLTVWTALDSGTEIELSVPAVHAYAATSASWRAWFNEILSGRAHKSGGQEASHSDSDSVD